MSMHSSSQCRQAGSEKPGGDPTGPAKRVLVSLRIEIKRTPEEVEREFISVSDGERIADGASGRCREERKMSLIVAWG